MDIPTGAGNFLKPRKDIVICGLWSGGVGEERVYVGALV